MEEGKMQKGQTFRFKIITLSVTMVSWCFLFSGTSAVESATTHSVTLSKSADGPGLYASKCVICHGKNGAGTAALRAKGQPDLSAPEWQKTHSDDQIAARIREGKGKMPGFKNKLSDDDINSLVRQVRTLRK
jgi:cytochrome c6